MRISDWSSDVCSSDLFALRAMGGLEKTRAWSARHTRVGVGVGGWTVQLGRSSNRDLQRWRSTVDCAERCSQACLLFQQGVQCCLVEREIPRRTESGPRIASQQAPPFQDRKRVVSGKSVSVRVYLGGGRINNKKTEISKNRA